MFNSTLGSRWIVLWRIGQNIYEVDDTWGGEREISKAWQRPTPKLLPTRSAVRENGLGIVCIPAQKMLPHYQEVVPPAPELRLRAHRTGSGLFFLGVRGTKPPRGGLACKRKADRDRGIGTRRAQLSGRKRAGMGSVCWARARGLKGTLC
jgi:hypothetical protein